MSVYQYCNSVRVELDNHEVYDSVSEIEKQISDNNERINEIKTKIIGLCCGNPKDLVVTEDCEGEKMNPIDSLYDYVNELIDGYYGLAYLYRKNVDLEYIKDNFDNTEIC